MAAGGMIHALHFATHRPEPIRQASLLMVLASGVSQGTDVIEMLRSYSKESKAPWSNKVKHLAMLLEQGRTLADSVAVIDGLLPEESVIAIRIAERSGNVETILTDEAIRLSRLSQRQNSSSNVSAGILCAATLTIAALVIVFLSKFIAPKHKEIFAGFGVRLPPLSASFFRLTDELPAIVALVCLPVVTLIVWGTVIFWKSQSCLLRTGSSNWFDWRPRWMTPMILRQLSLATIAQQPLDDSFHAILRVIYPGPTAARLSGVRQAVAGGTSWSEALRSAGFLTRRETRFLDSANITQHDDWAMRHLAVTLERRGEERTRKILGVFWPAMIVLTGVLVGCIVLAFYLPLVTLIHQLILDSEQPLTFS